MKGLISNKKKGIVLVLNIIAIFVISMLLIFRQENFTAKAQKINANGDSDKLSFDLLVTPEVVKVISGETVEISMDLSQVNVGENGLNSIVGNLKYDEKLFDSSCIHINAIEGGIPKDGPSAGTALTTAIISMLLKKSVPNTVAMTGEMTLTGKVLPIGGLKEKSLGAYQAGVKKMFVPKLNEADLSDIPKAVKDKIEIVLVQDYMDIYNDLFKKKN
mgnify:CR=1 FL=1